jgi:hypothetical protein
MTGRADWSCACQPEGEKMKVRFGVSVLSSTPFPHRRDLDKFAELIRIIDGSGVELIGTNDTSFIGGDAYVRATLIAQTAANAHVGIHPTNPLTREPQIMAAFMASIDAMTEGRASSISAAATARSTTSAWRRRPAPGWQTTSPACGI